MQLVNYTEVRQRGRNGVVVLQFAAPALKYVFPINLGYRQDRTGQGRAGQETSTKYLFRYREKSTIDICNDDANRRVDGMPEESKATINVA